VSELSRCSFSEQYRFKYGLLQYSWKSSGIKEGIFTNQENSVEYTQRGWGRALH
jgi:hypothetical protein